MSKKPRIVMVPVAVVPESDDVVLCGQIDRKTYIVVTKYRKCTFLDGGFSLLIGTEKKLKGVKVLSQSLSRFPRITVKMVTKEGTLFFIQDEGGGRYKGMFKGKRLKLYQSPA